MPEILVETYRGCKIYKYTPPDVPETVYGSPCIVGQYFTISAVKKRICEATGGSWVDGTCTAPPPPPTLPFPCPVCGFLFDTKAALQAHIASRHLDKPIEVYRGVESWWSVSLNMFRAQVEVGYVAVGLTLPIIRASIDEILDFLNPPEDPLEGLLAQVVAEVKAWFEPIWAPLSSAWDSFITYTWPALGASLSNLKASWDEFRTKAWVDLTAAFTSLGARWDAFTSGTLPGIWDAITAKGAEFQAALTNKAAELRAALDQGLADNREWMGNFAKLMDPMGFLKDPVGFINAAFALQGEIANNLAVKSFWEGFEEGLVEEEG